MTTPNQQAIEAGAKAAMEAAECCHPFTKGIPDCEIHGEPFEDLYVMDVFGYLSMTGTCPVAKRDATAILTAALPALEQQIREQVAQEIEAHQIKVESIHHIHGTKCLCGFDSHGRARSATEHVTHELNAAQIARGKDTQ